MILEEALQEHEERVDTLLKSAGKYVGALKAWKKACQVGHIVNLQKSSATAEELSGAFLDSTAAAKASWDFDTRAYLEGSAWQDELRETASDKYFLRTLQDEGNLISSPIIVRAQPGRSVLQLGKTTWPTIRPRVVAQELKRLRDLMANANSQEFAESLFGACEHLDPKDKPTARFRDIYKLFCLTPGFKKDNTPAAFGQQIYALQRAEIRATRSGHKFEIQTTSGNAKDSDVFSVMTEDGRLVRYYDIWFQR